MVNEHKRYEPNSSEKGNSEISKEKACVSIETSISTVILIKQHESYTINSKKAIT